MESLGKIGIKMVREVSLEMTVALLEDLPVEVLEEED